MSIIVSLQFTCFNLDIPAKTADLSTRKPISCYVLRKPGSEKVKLQGNNEERTPRHHWDSRASCVQAAF